MNTRVKVVFPANEPDAPSWPHIGYDVEKRSTEVLSMLRDRLPELEFTAEVDAQRILDNYHSELFGWHRVTCYGDYRKQLIDLATLYGLKIIEEDR